MEERGCEEDSGFVSKVFSYSPDDSFGLVGLQIIRNDQPHGLWLKH